MEGNSAIEKCAPAGLCRWLLQGARNFLLSAAVTRVRAGDYPGGALVDVSFNLIDQAWIPCVAIDEQLIEVSLRDMLARARIA